jgi:hypothetical protein
MAAEPGGTARIRARYRIETARPLDNLGPSLPNLIATVAGNLFELKQPSGLRLLDTKLPGALHAIAQAEPLLINPDWRERVFAPKAVLASVREICNPPVKG